MKRRVKIVATIGPSSDNRETLSKLIQAGIDVARLNFSHGTHEEHLAKIKLIRELSVELGIPVTILQDLQGPKLRVGTLPKQGVPLKAGEVLNMELDLDNRALDFIDGKEKTIFLEIPNILHSLKIGGRILLDDGELEMEILDVYSRGFKAKVVLGGTLFSHKGVNLPGIGLDIPGFTEKDQDDLKFGLENDVDAVAISFVRDANDIVCVRDFITQNKPERAGLPIIAKLELPQAIENLESILDVADGVMVARGDLGVETSPADVPVIQKRIILAANRKNKLVITATQMLDSMIENPRPTRAEASDVANAVFDGTDAVMLSGESASGKYPVESVRMMDAIALKAESNILEWGHFYQPTIDKDQDDAFAIAIAARELAQDRESRLHRRLYTVWPVGSAPIQSTPASSYPGVHTHQGNLQEIEPVLGGYSLPGAFFKFLGRYDPARGIRFDGKCAPFTGSESGSDFRFSDQRNEQAQPGAAPYHRQPEITT